MRAWFLWALALAVALLDCSSDPPAKPPVVLTSGGATVRVAADGLSIAVERDGVTLLTFPGDGIEIGTVDALDDTRSFDPYFRREIADHNGSLMYQWRALSFQARFRYATFPVRVRDVLFSVSRPF